MSLDTTSKRIIAVSIIVIISCFLPWWVLFSEYIPGSGESSYLVFISNPFLDSFVKFFYFGPEINLFSSMLHLNFYKSDAAASIVLLIAAIITLIGGVIGIISLGNKKIVLIAAAIVLVGVLIYLIGLAVGELPGLIDPTYFSDNGLNPIFGTHIRDFGVDEASDTFGISFGPIIAGLAGLALLILGLKSTKNRY